MFPGPGAEIHRNEAGEVLGWDYPDTEPPYCDLCGTAHSATWDCQDWDDEDDQDG